MAKGEFGKSKEKAMLHFLKEFKLIKQPESCAIVSDLGGDVNIAKKIDLTTFAVTTGFAKYESLNKTNPDAIFEDILKRQENSERKRVTFPSRKPRIE